MTTHQADSDRIRSAIAEIIDSDGDDPRLIGDITLIAEMTSPDGETELFTLWSDGLTVWKERGMLMHRLDRLAALAVLREAEAEED